MAREIIPFHDNSLFLQRGKQRRNAQELGIDGWPAKPRRAAHRRFKNTDILHDDSSIDLYIDIYEYLRVAKTRDGKKTIAIILAQKLPARVAKWICGDNDSRIADLRDNIIKDIANRINKIEIPVADIKYHNLESAEVVRGGVDTADISSKTMESGLCSGLYFAGEVLDIAGDLGGFNLQWAWASGFVAGNNA